MGILVPELQPALTPPAPVNTCRAFEIFPKVLRTHRGSVRPSDFAVHALCVRPRKVLARLFGRAAPRIPTYSTTQEDDSRAFQPGSTADK